MFTEKINTLANTIINYSLAIKEGEKILIEVNGEGTDVMLNALINETLKAKATPFWNRIDDDILSDFIKNASEDAIASWASIHHSVMESMNAYVSVRGPNNTYELSSIPGSQMALYNKHYFRKVHTTLRIPKRKWTVLRWPNHSMAQSAEMGLTEFSNLYFDACSLDYAELNKNMDPLLNLVLQTDQVRICSDNTDIRFSLKGINALKSAGRLNLPDGVIFTGPVKESVNGFITYNAPSIYQNKLFNNVRFEVSEGKIVDASCEGDAEVLTKILDTDDGARYFGAFGLCFNPKILNPIKDSLFDEKIYGSFYLAPGDCFAPTSNGNRSEVHWVLVQIQTPDYGGGEIYFDDKLIRKDGDFVIDELKALNR